MIEMNSILTNQIKEDYFIKLYFNISDGFELAGIKRAYLDFCRTLKIEDEKRIDFREKIENYLLINLKKICLTNKFESQEEFDLQHKTWCEEIRDIWPQLSYGQTQKWVNMTLKYWLLFGETKIKGIELNSSYFHIPIDSYVQKGMFHEKSPKPWSKIDNYSDYMKYQLTHRNKLTGNDPIVDEFIFFNQYKLIK